MNEDTDLFMISGSSTKLLFLASLEYLTQIPSCCQFFKATCFSIMDLCSAFFNVCLDQESQYFLLSPGKNSSIVEGHGPGTSMPHVLFPCAPPTLKKTLSFPCNSVLIQYVNDLPLCRENKKKSYKRASIYLLSTLAKEK